VRRGELLRQITSGHRGDKMNVCQGILGTLCATALAAHAAGPWTLDQAIRHALTNSPDARIAQHRIAAAQAGLNQARAAFSPQLQFQSSYVRTDNPMLAFGSILNQHAVSSSPDFNNVPDQDNANFRGLLTLPLYAGGRNVAGRDSARASAESASLEAIAVRNALEFEVARAFHTVSKTREFIAATEAGAQAFETNLALANRRLNVGTLLKSDVLDVEVRLAQAREEAVRARNANALALRALRNLLGMEQGELEIADSAPAASNTVPDVGDFQSRAELAASAQKVRAAEADTRRASSGYQPRVSAFGSLDYDYGTRTDGSGHSYTAGVLLQWDLWDGLNTHAQRQAADANLETAREQQRKLRLALALELEQARLALREASERLAVTATSVAQAAESVDLTRSRFEQGLAISTQLIDAQTALIAARVRRAEAEADQKIAVAAVRQALGYAQLSNERSTLK